MNMAVDTAASPGTVKNAVGISLVPNLKLRGVRIARGILAFFNTGLNSLSAFS